MVVIRIQKIRSYILGNIHGFTGRQEYGSILFNCICRICFGANWTDSFCNVHGYKEKYGESFKMDAKADFNNNRRDVFADSNYGSEDSWNDYISLAKTSLVDFVSSQG